MQIRLAEKRDISALVDLHCASFGPEEHVPVMLGKGYVRATYRWQVSSKRAYTLVAEEESRIVGLIAVSDGAFTFPMFVSCLPEFILSLVRRPSRLFKKKLWRRLMRRSDLNAASRRIASLPGFAQMTIGAVAEDYRGKSVFPALVEATKGFSRERGSRAIRAGVYKTNRASRRVFEKGQWIEMLELETEDTVFFVAYLDSGISREIKAVADGQRAL